MGQVARGSEDGEGMSCTKKKKEKLHEFGEQCENVTEI